MILSECIIGDAGEDRYAGRATETIQLSAQEATKRRLRCTTDAGTDVGIDVAPGTFLSHGAVLHDDGVRIIVVARRPERVMTLSLPPTLAATALVQLAARIGHAFGNQHVPIEIEGLMIRVPVTTSDSVAARTVHNLLLEDVGIDFGEERLALYRSLASAHAHS